MTSSALIFADQTAADSDRLRSLLVAGGLPSIVRQLRQLERIGITRVYVVSLSKRMVLEGALRRAKGVPADVEILSPDEFHPETLWKADEPVLLVEEGVVIDKRILEAAAADPESKERRLVVFPGHSVVAGKAHGLKLQAAEQEYLFGSAARVWGGDVAHAEADPDFAASPLKAVLKAAIVTGPPTLIDVTQLPTYMPDRRRKVDVVWRPITSRAEAAKATRVIIAASQKGVLDWPAKYLHPLLEDILVEVLCPAPVTPNMITALTAVGGIAVAWLFATGQMGLGLIGALLVGVLDGVDGKLARTKLESTKVGELEHILDKIVEYAWYFAIAWHLAEVTGNALPWALAAIISLFSWAEAVQGEFFRRMTGRQLDDTGEFERGFRLIGARRNTKFWLLVPFAVYHVWLAGFVVLAFYGVATFLVAQVRFIVRVREFASRKSVEIKRNFDDSAYF
jgi:phosphatidylglycerophosphate synthase